MSKHTPGPWSVGPSHIIKAVTEIPEGNRQTKWVAEAIYCLPLVEGELEANACLIAAAPNMLAALREIQVIAEQNVTDLCAIVQEGGQLSPIDKMELSRWQSVGAAIAKAEGRT